MKKRARSSSTLKPFGSTKRFYTVDKVAGSSSAPADKTAHVIYRALENPQYKWRTIDGVAKETGVAIPTIHRVINKLGEQVVKSHVPSTTGDDLFTTRRHLRQSESLISRFGAILRNRAT